MHRYRKRMIWMSDMILRLSHDIIIHRQYPLLVDGHSLSHTCFFPVKWLRSRCIASQHRPQQCSRRNNQFSTRRSGLRGAVAFVFLRTSDKHTDNRHCVILVSFANNLPIFLSVSLPRCGPLKSTWNVAHPNNQPCHRPLQQVNMAVQSL